MKSQTKSFCIAKFRFVRYASVVLFLCQFLTIAGFRRKANIRQYCLLCVRFQSNCLPFKASYGRISNAGSIFTSFQLGGSHQKRILIQFANIWNFFCLHTTKEGCNLSKVPMFEKKTSLDGSEELKSRWSQTVGLREVVFTYVSNQPMQVRWEPKNPSFRPMNLYKETSTRLN